MKDCIKYVRAPNGNFVGEVSNVLNASESDIFVSKNSDPIMRNLLDEMIKEKLQGRESSKRKKVAFILLSGEIEKFFEEQEEQEVLYLELLENFEEYDEIFIIQGQDELVECLKIV